MPASGLVLVLGGIRSGSGEVAHQIAAEGSKPLRSLNLASEDSSDISGSVSESEKGTIIVEGLDSWIASRLQAKAKPASLARSVQLLAQHAQKRRGLTIVLAQEVGLAPLSGSSEAGRFAITAGDIHRTLAAAAKDVFLVVAGRAIRIPAADEHQTNVSTPPKTQAPNKPSESEEEAAAQAPLRSSARQRQPGQHGLQRVPAGTLDFALNVVAGNPPGWAIQSLQEGMREVGLYPDETPAINALALHHLRPHEGVLPLGGAADGFWRVALAARPRKSAIVVPGLVEAEAALRAVSSEIVHVARQSKDDWALDPEAVPEDCDLVVICRPGNPTGVVDSREAVMRLRRPGRTVLVDESLADFIADSQHSLADQLPDDGGAGEVVVLRSLSSVLGIPGVRCGYALGSPEMITAMRASGPPWSCSTAALALLRVYAETEDATKRITARTAAHRDDLVARLRQVAGVQVWNGWAPFALARVPTGVNAVQGLLDRGFAVQGCAHVPTLDDSYIRISVRTPAVHARLAIALAEVISVADKS